jgi:hypothetical protein
MFIVVLDYVEGKVLKFILSDVEAVIYKRDPDEYFSDLCETYNLRESDCSWMVLNELNEETIIVK